MLRSVLPHVRIYWKFRRIDTPKNAMGGTDAANDEDFYRLSFHTRE